MSPEVQRVLAAISNLHRLDILALLYEMPLSAVAITYLIEKSQPDVAYHLRILRQAGLVRRERDGVYVIYELADVRTRLFARGLANLLR